MQIHFTGFIAAFFTWNFIKRARTHEILTGCRLHNSFFNAQLIEQHQDFKQALGIFIFQISGASASRHNKTQECIKLDLPFNGKPTLKNRDNFARSNRLKWRAELAGLGTFDLLE